MYALIDCNNFYASCERVFRPDLEKKPVVILSNNDGCIISRSDEAKALGIGMGVPLFQIQSLVKRHDITVFSSNYALYGDFSNRVMQSLFQLVPQLEVYSIDEAFLDLRQMPYHDLYALGQDIRHKIRQWTGIPVSLGIAPTKTLAKAANRYVKAHVKEEGVFVIEDNFTADIVLAATPIEEVWGVGRRYGRFLVSHEIRTAFDLVQMPDAWIQQHLKIVGRRMVRELRGEVCYSLDLEPHPKKGICVSRSFQNTVIDVLSIQEAVATFAARCGEKLRRQKSRANILHLFLFTNPHHENDPQYFGSKVLQFPTATNSSFDLVAMAHRALDLVFKAGYRYKKVGVMVSGIVPENTIQTALFDVHEPKRLKDHRIFQTVDALNRTLGRDKIRIAAQGNGPSTHQAFRSPCYTTRWEDMLVIDERINFRGKQVRGSLGRSLQ
ncbi:Y-family DNA polymerase [Runella slithyformis]|uniref:DNA-directed DNA polymerase n=1 Tax=Runella slithyformis (strain ATCC 29530 / DSM 19594 / LMG 11500 / NCIMB 11436 / LSU 4) TaxID=761193 RepID=A0A7U3ZQQ1_RUNSL|nr:Y-family DNA polymerase [Runella slithyformis]AEI51617.1 DNA-directed DNA polymerase [Runella slithyformis DSM 19594]